MKLILHPTDQNFKANVAELHDASGASEPTEYHVNFRGDAQRPTALPYPGSPGAWRHAWAADMGKNHYPPYPSLDRQPARTLRRRSARNRSTTG